MTTSINFAPGVNVVPQLGPNGRVTNVLESTYAEVVGQRGTAFAELPNQFNFLVPPGVSLGYQPVRIIQGCGTSNEVRSEPQ